MACKTIGRCILLAMATDAPAHLQRSNLLNDFHSLNFSVTVLARKAGLDVTLVSKSNEVRKVVNLDPFHRFVVFEFLGNVLDVRFVSCDRLVTTHACI